MRRRAAVIAGIAALAGGCRDLSGFSTVDGGHYDGYVVPADFVLAGVHEGTRMCLTLDTDHLQDAPGAITSSDGRFHATPLRSIPQIWHDPLSTLSFGEGRVKNLLYVAEAAPSGGDAGGDVYVVVSLMQSGGIEVRTLRGAPGAPVADGGKGSGGNLFAIFELQRGDGPCAF